MASYFCVFPATDAHIEFMQAHPQSISSYLGEEPDELAAALPGDWPTAEAHPIGFDNAIHRNVDLYHRILNGTPDFVDGSGCLFQTWLTDQHSAIDLDGCNESLAFKSGRIAELAALVGKVDVPAVQEAFTAWCRERGKDYQPDTAACQPFVDEFRAFGRQLEAVMAKGMGIIWVPG